MIAAPSPRIILISITAIVLISLLSYQFHPLPLTLPSYHPPPSSLHPPREQSWLIATECAAKSQTRRNVIRATWQTLYPSPHFTPRFILSDYDPLWAPLIEAENKTYGDIIQLKGVDPSPHVSNRIKFMELVSYLAERGERWGWVSKVDDDAFLEAQKFWDRYLDARTPAAGWTNKENPDAKANSNNTLTLISMKNRHDFPFDWPGGAFYTVSWPLAEKLAEIHQEQREKDKETPEDVRMGKYLSEAKVEYEYREMPREEMFEIPVKGARIPHRITREAIVVHFLKDHDTYLQVADLFGEGGYKGAALKDWTG